MLRMPYGIPGSYARKMSGRSRKIPDRGIINRKRTNSCKGTLSFDGLPKMEIIDARLWHAKLLIPLATGIVIFNSVADCSCVALWHPCELELVI